MNITSKLLIIIALAFSASANSALLSRLGGQAYYDDNLNITWTTDANINGADLWSDQVSWADGFTLAGESDWRLATIDELSYLYSTEGIKASTPGPFNNLLGQPNYYWSGTTTVGEPSQADYITFSDAGGQNTATKSTNNLYAWAVHSGDVSAVPVPAAAWLFGSGLIGLIGVARKKKT